VKGDAQAFHNVEDLPDRLSATGLDMVGLL
jgi:hypothetical protein